MPKIKFNDDYVVTFTASWEIAEGEWEPPVWSVIAYDESDHDHTVREFDHYPAEQEVLNAISEYKKSVNR